MTGDPGRALDLLAAAGQLVEVLALVAHRRVHRRHLGDLAHELAEGRAHPLGVEAGGVAARGDHPLGVQGVGPLAQPHRAAVALGLAVEVVDQAGGAAEAEREQAPGHGVEGAGVADPALAVDPAHLADAVEGGLSRLLVQGQHRVQHPAARGGRGGDGHGYGCAPEQRPGHLEHALASVLERLAQLGSGGPPVAPAAEGHADVGGVHLVTAADRDLGQVAGRLLEEHGDLHRGRRSGAGR